MRHSRLLAIWLLLGLCACENQGRLVSPGGPPLRPMITGVTFSDTTPKAGETMAATINFSGIGGPTEFTATFSDCVMPLVHIVTAPAGATSVQLEFSLDDFTTTEDPDGKDCSITVSETSGAWFGLVTGSFHVEGSDA
jgi:hypothetical protein